MSSFSARRIRNASQKKTDPKAENLGISATMRSSLKKKSWRRKKEEEEEYQGFPSSFSARRKRNETRSPFHPRPKSKHGQFLEKMASRPFHF